MSEKPFSPKMNPSDRAGSVPRRPSTKVPQRGGMEKPASDGNPAGLIDSRPGGRDGQIQSVDRENGASNTWRESSNGAIVDSSIDNNAFEVHRGDIII